MASQKNYFWTTLFAKLLSATLGLILVATSNLSIAAAVEPEDGVQSVLRQVLTSSQNSTDAIGTQSIEKTVLGGPNQWTSPSGLANSLQVIALVTILSLAPAILLMTTCYVRIVVVMGLLRTALGTQQLPPNQVMTSIALFMTMFVMAPVWTEVYDKSIKPYSDSSSGMTLDQAWEAGAQPVRNFMSRQISMAGNHDDVHLFYKYYSPKGPPPKNFDEVPLRVLLPAYMLSELKIAFVMGFQIYLPFLILDIVIASVTISMGMMMLPPAMISMPFKLLLFVLLDGWRLVVQMLLDSFGTYGT